MLTKNDNKMSTLMTSGLHKHEQNDRYSHQLHLKDGTEAILGKPNTATRREARYG